MPKFTDWEKRWKELVKVNFDGMNGDAYGISETEEKVNFLGITFISDLLSSIDETLEKEKLNRRVPSKESGLPFAIYVWDESRNVYTAKIQHGDDVQYKSITKIDLEVPGAYIDPDKGFNDGLTKAQEIVKGKE